jgi:transposase-like protein
MRKRQPALFKGRHFELEIVVASIRWYLRYALSYRDVEELMAEGNLRADHGTIWGCVQHYVPELAERCRRELRPINASVGKLPSGLPLVGGPQTWVLDSLFR